MCHASFCLQACPLVPLFNVTMDANAPKPCRASMHTCRWLSSCSTSWLACFVVLLTPGRRTVGMNRSAWLARARGKRKNSVRCIQSAALRPWRVTTFSDLLYAVVHHITCWHSCAPDSSSLWRRRFQATVRNTVVHGCV